jgi:hypothetical protein
LGFAQPPVIGEKIDEHDERRGWRFRVGSGAGGSAPRSFARMRCNISIGGYRLCSTSVGYR